jgi:hypothetical protein
MGSMTPRTSGLWSSTMGSDRYQDEDDDVEQQALMANEDDDNAEEEDDGRTPVSA